MNNQQIIEHIDDLFFRQSLDQALIFFVTLINFLFALVFSYSDIGQIKSQSVTGVLLDFVPFLFTGFLMPIYVGYIRGSLIQDSLFERFRGWIYFIFGLVMYVNILMITLFPYAYSRLLGYLLWLPSLLININGLLSVILTLLFLAAPVMILTVGSLILIGRFIFRFRVRIRGILRPNRPYPILAFLTWAIAALMYAALVYLSKPSGNSTIYYLQPYIYLMGAVAIEAFIEASVSPFIINGFRRLRIFLIDP